MTSHAAKYHFLWRMSHRRSWSSRWHLKKRPPFKIKQVFFVVFFFHFSCFVLFIFMCVGSRTRRPLDTNAPTLQSFINSNQCINNLWSYWFLRFYTVSFIYNKNHPFIISFKKKKKNHMVHPGSLGPGGKKNKIDHVRRASAFGRPFSFIRDENVPAHVSACPRWVRFMLMPNQRGVTCFASSCWRNHAL